MQIEQHRHQYLNALGITSWLSRTASPAAKASEPWVADFVYTGGDSTEEKPRVVGEQTKKGVRSTAAADQSNRSQAKSLSASLVTGSEAPSIKPAPNDVDESALSVTEPDTSIPARVAIKTDPESSENIPRHVPVVNPSNRPAPVMRLMFWQYKDVLVIDTLPPQNRGNSVTEQYQGLLGNILKAMGFENELQQSPYSWNWPTLAGISIDQGWDQAVSAVQHKLAKIFQQSQYSLVLLLGESAAQMALSREEEFDALRGIVFTLRSDTKTLTTFSLSQMMNVPGCKRDVWLDLQKVINTDDQM